ALAPDATGRTRLDVAFGLGLLNAFRGLDDEAVRFLEEAAQRGELDPDHWARSQVLTRIPRLELERGRPGEALARCHALEPLVAKLSEGSERPLVVALQCLARLGGAGHDE